MRPPSAYEISEFLVLLHRGTEHLLEQHLQFSLGAGSRADRAEIVPASRLRRLWAVACEGESPRRVSGLAVRRQAHIFTKACMHKFKWHTRMLVDKVPHQVSIRIARSVTIK
jgi:hypothetical protein